MSWCALLLFCMICVAQRGLTQDAGRSKR
eukprot:COSAG06_NODE_65716_length_256_cov_0.662420_1_plen_28_part_01